MNSREVKSGIGTKLVNNNVQVPIVLRVRTKKPSLFSETFIKCSIKEFLE
jgi:hypothetical protein